MGWEVDSTSKIQGKTAASASIGGGSSKYSGDSEHLKIAGRSKDWYVGVVNNSSEADSDFFIGKSSQADSIFNISQDTGYIGIGTNTPTVELDVSGTINATALTVNGVTVATSSSTYWSEAGSLLTYSSNPVNITNTTDSSSADGLSGALRTTGGASIAKKLYVGTDLDVDGTTHLDAVDIDVAVQIDAALTVGVNDTGYDVKYFGASNNKYMMWDESEDELLFSGGAGIKFDTASPIEILNGSATALTVAETGGNTILTLDTSNEQIEIDNASLVVSNDIEIDTANTLSLSHSSSKIDINSTLDSNSAAGNNGAIQCLGGVSIAKNLYVGQSGTTAKLVFDGNGGVDFNGSGAITMDAGAASNFTTSAGDLTLSSAASVDILATKAAADAIYLNCANAAGGIDINARNGGVDISSSGPYKLECSESSTSTDSDSSQTYTSLIKVDGGTSEKLLLQSTQGTNSKSISLHSVAGGIDLRTVHATQGDITIAPSDNLNIEANDDINITAGADGGSGNIEIDATDGTNGIKIGVGNSCPVSIGNTSSETTINDNLTVTGTFSGGRSVLENVAVDDTLTAAESGKIFVFGDAAAVLTLPDSGDGSLIGVTYTFITKFQGTGQEVKCSDTSNEVIIGSLTVADTDDITSGGTFTAEAAQNFSSVEFTGTTEGEPGSMFKLTCIATDLWFIEGTVLSAGTSATPFATS